MNTVYFYDSWGKNINCWNPFSACSNPTGPIKINLLILQERARSTAMGYEDPTCPTYEATTASFHKCLQEVLTRVSGNKENLNVMVASHNEDTVRYTIQMMNELKIKPEDKIVCFGQLLGMCDHVTFPLGKFIQLFVLLSCM